MLKPSRFNAGSLLKSADIHTAIHGNPRMSRFAKRFARFEGGSERPLALLEGLLRHAVSDIGDIHIGNAISRLKKVEMLRESLASVFDHVLEEGELPPGIGPEHVDQLFHDLDTEMRGLMETQRSLFGDGEIPMTEGPATYAEWLLAEFNENHEGVGVHVEPDAEIKAAMKELPPDVRSTLRKAAKLRGKELAATILANEEKTQDALLNSLDESLHGDMSDADLARVRAGVVELSKARNTALRVDDIRLHQALLRIADPELRAMITRGGGDRWLIQPLAMHNPLMLVELWNRFRAQGGSATNRSGFRAFVRHDMVTYGRAAIGEYTAAFSLSSVELFLKGPDANVKIAGTDLIGVTREGWVWLVDDKSHSAKSVSSVSSLTDNLAVNLRKDVAAFRKSIDDIKVRDPEFVPEPAIVDAIKRMEDLAGDVEKINSSTPTAKRPEAIRAALDNRRVKLKVTSAAGTVTEISEALEALGLSYESTNRPAIVPTTGSTP